MSEAGTEENQGSHSDTNDVTPNNWRDSINEEYRGDPGLADIKDVDSLAKGYLSSQRMLGGRIKIPNENSTPEDVTAFNSKLMEVPGVLRIPEDGDVQGTNELYAKLGRPETHDLYTYKPPEEMPQGLESNSDITDWFKKVGHENGLSDKAVTAIMGGWDQIIINQHNEKTQAMESASVEMEKEWGAAYTERLGAARGILTEHGSPELEEILETSGLGNNPYFTRFLSKLGMLTLEDSAIQGGIAQASQTNDEIREEINSLMMNPAYTNSQDLMHKQMVDKVSKLNKKLYPD